MPKLFFLRTQIFFSVRARSDFARNPFDDANAGSFKSLNLVRIVRQQPHSRNAETFENATRQGEIAMVRLEPKALVGFNRIQSRILQFVGLEFGHQTNAAPLLLLVNENASAFFCDHGERKFELLAAIAA